MQKPNRTLLNILIIFLMKNYRVINRENLRYLFGPKKRSVLEE